MSDIPRRDPRVERILRNRLHPQHQAYAAAQGPVRGPTGLLRKNPHSVGFIGPNGIKRIDRSGGYTGGAGGVTSGAQRGRSGAEEAPLPLHRVEQPDYLIAVVLDLPAGRLSSHDRDCLGQAHQLIRERGDNGAVLAIALGDDRGNDYDTAGADRLLRLTAFGDAPLTGYCPEQKLAVLNAVERQWQPRHWLFPDSIHGGGELGRRFAARQGERPAARAWQVDSEETVSRGGSQRTDWYRPTPRVLLLAEECARPIDETRHEALALELAEQTPVRPQVEDLGPVEVDPSQIDLAEAEFILSAGNGIRDWDQFHEAARTLGASEGASRVAVDDGFMPRYRQVGATGTFVTARVYVAVGISGAIQHLQGIGQCDKVVAINMDGGCDMIKRADLSVIGDSQAILGELLNLMAERRGAVPGSAEPTTPEPQEARDVA